LSIVRYIGAQLSRSRGEQLRVDFFDPRYATERHRDAHLRFDDC